jgi:TIR domain
VPRDQVFISYSHTDRQWLESLQTMLKPLVRKNSLSVWDDTTIKAGAKWKEEIERALGKAKVAVLIVTHNFLNSDFIAEHELPPLLDAAAKEGLIILWIYASSCLFDETEIRDYQAAHDISKPLDSLTPAKRSVVLVEVCKPIKAAVNVVDPSPEAEPRGVGQEVHANVASQNTRRLITNIEFTLERPFAEFDEEKFKNALKLVTGIDASQIRIASIRSGSTIVKIDGKQETLAAIIRKIQFSQEIAHQLALQTGMRKMAWEIDGKRYELTVGDLSGDVELPVSKPAIVQTVPLTQSSVERQENADTKTGQQQRKAGFWRGIWHWWIGLNTELKVPVKKPTQVICAFAFGVVFIVVMLVIAIDIPYPPDFRFLTFRVILALAAGGIAGMLTGFISAGISKVVRAGGALAAFAAIYFLNPASLAILHRRLECLLRSYLKVGAWLNTFGNKRT